VDADRSSRGAARHCTQQSTDSSACWETSRLKAQSDITTRSGDEDPSGHPAARSGRLDPPRPRGRTLADLVAVEKKIKHLTKELKAILEINCRRLINLPGVGRIVAARIFADVGHVTRFADWNRFASCTPRIELSSGETGRHRLSRAGNRRMNHMIHIAATPRSDSTPRAAPAISVSSPPARPG